MQNHKKNKSMTTSKTNLYITGLSESDTDETVRALVENIVSPKSCKAMLLNGKCKGSGFIDCATEEDAVKALTHLVDVSKNGGRQLVVKYALENEKDRLNVYVRNLPRTGFTKETLLNLFRPFGQVTSVKLLETDGSYTGIGFVRFASAEQAQRAVDSMNEKRYVLIGDNANGGESSNGNDAAKPISCKLADKADPKRRAAAVAAAAAAVMATRCVATGLSSSSSAGPSRGKLSTSRHHQPPSQQLICGDSHLQNHHQQQNPIATATSALSSSQQLPTDLIYQPSMLPNGTGPIATACYPNPPYSAIDIHDTSCSDAPVVTSVGTRASSSVVGLIDMPAPQSPPIDRHHHQLLPQPPLINNHSSAPVIDSRYAAHLAAAAASNNAAMYPPSNAIVAASHQFPQPSQQPLVQPAYTAASGSVVDHRHHHHYYGGHPNSLDLAAEQLRSLTLAAVRQSQLFYPEWQSQGFQPASVAPAAAYQQFSRGGAFVDGPSAAAAAAALLHNYVQMSQAMLLSLPLRRSVHSTSPQVVENLEQQPALREHQEELFVQGEDRVDSEVTTAKASTESTEQN